MEKRVVLFTILCMGIMAGYMYLQYLINPPQPVAGNDPQANAEQDGGEPGAEPEKQEPAGGGGDPAEVDGPEGTPAPAKTPDPEKADPEKADPEKAEPKAQDDGQWVAGAPGETPQWISVGDYAGKSGSQIVATFTSKGAGLECVEVIEREGHGKFRYRHLEDDGTGYPGYLGLTDVVAEPGGCRVNVVPEGTPAAAAGIQVGDVIIQVNQTVVRDRVDYRRLLGQSKEADTWKLTLLRTDSASGKTAERQVELTLMERPVALIHPAHNEHGESMPSAPSFRVRLIKLGDKFVDAEDPEMAAVARMADAVWASQPLADGVAFSYRLSSEQLRVFGVTGPLEIIKRFRVQTSSEPATGPNQQPYHLKFELEFVNEGSEELKLNYELEGANSLTSEGWWYQNKIHPGFSGAGARDIVWANGDNRRTLLGCPNIYSTARKTPERPENVIFNEGNSEAERTLRYIGNDVQYFAVALLPENYADLTETLLFESAEAYMLGDPEAYDKSEIKSVNTGFRVRSMPVRVPPAASEKPGREAVRFTVFAGPKRPPLLANYQIDNILEYGWFGSISRPLSFVLHFFYALVWNYGIAVVLLTVLVRGCMFPLSLRAAKNAKIMQELAPEMKKISEKYKDDMQKRSEATQELYKKHNFNPLGGCLPMFIQLPIFLGLYRCLSVDIELRQAPLIPGLSWCSNLAGPDKLWRWDAQLPEFLSGHGTGWLGPYLNVLPIITIGLFLLQQKLFTPPATDETQKTQQQVMKFMMLFFCVMFFKVPAGLCIYFIASSLWGIAERQFLPKSPLAQQAAQKAEAKSVAAVEEARAKAKSRKKNRR